MNNTNLPNETSWQKIKRGRKKQSTETKSWTIRTFPIKSRIKTGNPDGYKVPVLLAKKICFSGPYTYFIINLIFCQQGWFFSVLIVHWIAYIFSMKITKDVRGTLLLCVSYFYIHWKSNSILTSVQTRQSLQTVWWSCGTSWLTPMQDGIGSS